MGCHGSKQKRGEEIKSKRKVWLSLLARIRKNNKVLPLNVPDINEEAVAKVGSPSVPPNLEDSHSIVTKTNVGTPMLFLTRKSEDIILQQLKEEGIVSDSKRTGGGVAFTITLKDEKQASEHVAKMSFPEAPKYSREESVLMSQIVAEERLVKKLPRVLPPISKAPKDGFNDLKGYTPEERQIMAEVWRNSELHSKGKMARLSSERKEMAAERREMKQTEKKERVEKKRMQRIQKNENKKVKVEDKLKKAKMNREALQLDLKVRTEEKLSKSLSKVENSGPKITTEEKLERARLNREMRDAARREKWLQKEQKLEAVRIRKEETMKKCEGSTSSAPRSGENKSQAESVGERVKEKEKE